MIVRNNDYSVERLVGIMAFGIKNFRIMTFGNKKNTIINNFRIKKNNNNKSNYVDLCVGKINVPNINFSEKRRGKNFWYYSKQ